MAKQTEVCGQERTVFSPKFVRYFTEDKCVTGLLVDIPSNELLYEENQLFTEDFETTAEQGSAFKLPWDTFRTHKFYDECDTNEETENGDIVIEDIADEELHELTKTHIIDMLIQARDVLADSRKSIHTLQRQLLAAAVSQEDIAQENLDLKRALWHMSEDLYDKQTSTGISHPSDFDINDLEVNRGITQLCKKYSDRCIKQCVYNQAARKQNRFDSCESDTDADADADADANEAFDSVEVADDVRRARVGDAVNGRDVEKHDINGDANYCEKDRHVMDERIENKAREISDDNVQRDEAERTPSSSSRSREGQADDAFYQNTTLVNTSEKSQLERDSSVSSKEKLDDINSTVSTHSKTIVSDPALACAKQNEETRQEEPIKILKGSASFPQSSAKKKTEPKKLTLKVQSLIMNYKELNEIYNVALYGENERLVDAYYYYGDNNERTDLEEANNQSENEEEGDLEEAGQQVDNGQFGHGEQMDVNEAYDHEEEDQVPQHNASQDDVERDHNGSRGGIPDSVGVNLRAFRSRSQPEYVDPLYEFAQPNSSNFLVPGSAPKFQIPDDAREFEAHEQFVILNSSQTDDSEEPIVDPRMAELCVESTIHKEYCLGRYVRDDVDTPNPASSSSHSDSFPKNDKNSFTVDFCETPSLTNDSLEVSPDSLARRPTPADTLRETECNSDYTLTPDFDFWEIPTEESEKRYDVKAIEDNTETETEDNGETERSGEQQYDEEPPLRHVTEFVYELPSDEEGAITQADGSMINKSFGKDECDEDLYDSLEKITYLDDKPHSHQGKFTSTKVAHNANSTYTASPKKWSVKKVKPLSSTPKTDSDSDLGSPECCTDSEDDMNKSDEHEGHRGKNRDFYPESVPKSSFIQYTPKHSQRDPVTTMRFPDFQSKPEVVRKTWTIANEKAESASYGASNHTSYDSTEVDISPRNRKEFPVGKSLPDAADLAARSKAKAEFRSPPPESKYAYPCSPEVEAEIADRAKKRKDFLSQSHEMKKIDAEVNHKEISKGARKMLDFSQKPCASSIEKAYQSTRLQRSEKDYQIDKMDKKKKPKVHNQSKEAMKSETKPELSVQAAVNIKGVHGKPSVPESSSKKKGPSQSVKTVQLKVEESPQTTAGSSSKNYLKRGTTKPAGVKPPAKRSEYQAKFASKKTREKKNVGNTSQEQRNSSEKMSEAQGSQISNNIWSRDETDEPMLTEYQARYKAGSLKESTPGANRGTEKTDTVAPSSSLQQDSSKTGTDKGCLKKTAKLPDCFVNACQSPAKRRTAQNNKK